MNKVLITGIDSFTGIHLSSYLEKSGYDVYGTSLSKSDVKKYKCDITSKNDITDVLDKVKPDYLIHLSGISFAAHGNNEDFYRVNTIGTTNILDAFLGLGQNPKKIILASSATVYGNQGLEVLDESLCPRPANHYGASKYAMECLSREYFTKLPIIITRPFNYTGAGQAEHFLIPKILKHYKENKQVIELGNLHVSREFNDVEYVCEIYKRLIECDSKGEIVNICSNNGIKLLDVIDIMNKLSGYKIKVDVNPAFIRKDEINILIGSTKKLFKLIEYIEQKDFKLILEEIYNG
jgi:nucleoside-diphosphate-sugar epimerase